MTGTLDERSSLSSLSNVYSLLAQLWSSELDGNLLSRLSRQPLRGEFEAMISAVPEASQLDQLAVEYCEILVGPRDHLLPLQSVWEDGQLQGEITDSVRAFADVFRFTPATSSLPDFPDHLGFQLALMSRAVAWSSESNSASETLEAARELFRRHLTWTNPFLKRVTERDSVFYASLARATSDFLRCEREQWL